jgi:hypothetical protein
MQFQHSVRRGSAARKLGSSRRPDTGGLIPESAASLSDRARRSFLGKPPQLCHRAIGVGGGACMVPLPYCGDNARRNHTATATKWPRHAA